MKVIVLGCGLVGKAIVRDLAHDSELELTVVDSQSSALEEATESLDVRVQLADLSKPGATRELARVHDIVVNALPGNLGYQALQESVEAGCHVVDISFMPEDPTGIHEIAKNNKVAAIVDNGLCPGLSHMLVGRAAAALDEIREVKILVGGLPVIRHLPFEYGALFSLSDVLEEYTRPAFIVENGLEETRPALTELEQIDVPGVGTLEAFLTDRLRTLRRSIGAPNMKVKLLRYPGHCERMRLLTDTGLLSAEPIVVGGVEISPREVAIHLLSERWKLEPGEEDLTVLHVEVRGKDGGDSVFLGFDLVDVFDSELGVTSMARTTGYTCSAVVRLLAKGAIEDVGVIPPENIGGRAEYMEEVLNQLAERGIQIAEIIAPDR